MDTKWTNFGLSTIKQEGMPIEDIEKGHPNGRPIKQRTWKNEWIELHAGTLSEYLQTELNIQESMAELFCKNLLKDSL